MRKVNLATNVTFCNDVWKLVLIDFFMKSLNIYASPRNLQWFSEELFHHQLVKVLNWSPFDVPDIFLIVCKSIQQMWWQKNLTGCGKFEDQCPKCVCFQMQKLRFLAGKSASSPSSYIDFGSLFPQVNVVIWFRVWWFCLKSFSKSQRKPFWTSLLIFRLERQSCLVSLSNLTLIATNLIVIINLDCCH